MKKHKMIILVVSILFCIPCISIYYSYHSWRNKFNKDLIPIIENSVVLEDKIGKVNSVRNKWFSYPKTVGNKGQLTYIIDANDQTYEVTVVIDIKNEKFYIEEYVIDDKVYKENIN